MGLACVLLMLIMVAWWNWEFRKYTGCGQVSGTTQWIDLRANNNSVQHFLKGIAAFIINLSIGVGIGQSVFGLVGIAVLYGVLQIKKDNIPAWDKLE